MKDRDGDACGHGDEVFLGPRLFGDARLAVRHTSNHDVVPCIASPVVDGRPLDDHGEVVALERISKDRYAITGSYRTGPARVTSNAYRDGWDRVFSGDLN